jgi:pimeloyl-ACP methyl ester carboxylesterase
LRLQQQQSLANPAPGTQDLYSAYLEVGPEQATTEPPLVLVHGYTGSTLDFQDQLPAFAQQRRVLAFDQRGHGHSSHQAIYRLDQLVIDLLGWLDALEIEHCDLLGHSMGGVVAMNALIAQPTRFRSLILMDTSAQPIKLMSESMANQLADTVIQGGCQALVALMQGGQGAPPTPAVQRSIDLLGEAEHWRRIKVKLEQMDPQAFVQLGQELAEHELPANQLATIECPTTVVVGALDTPFLGPSKHLAASLPNASLQQVPNAAHSPQFENPEYWQHTIADHLANLR